MTSWPLQLAKSQPQFHFAILLVFHALKYHETQRSLRGPPFGSHWFNKFLIKSWQIVLLSQIIKIMKFTRILLH